jgi:hypothetical protein
MIVVIDLEHIKKKYNEDFIYLNQLITFEDICSILLVYSLNEYSRDMKSTVWEAITSTHNSDGPIENLSSDKLLAIDCQIDMFTQFLYENCSYVIGFNIQDLSVDVVDFITNGVMLELNDNTISSIRQKNIKRSDNYVNTIF